MSDELDKKIEIIEHEWNIYHKNPRENRMPDMMELAKLRASRDKLKRGDRWKN